MNRLIDYFLITPKKGRHTGYMRAISTFLACVVVFVTTYQLILPAITLEAEVADDMPGFDMNSADADYISDIPYDDVSDLTDPDNQFYQNGGDDLLDINVSEDAQDGSFFISNDIPENLPAVSYDSLSADADLLFTEDIVQPTDISLTDGFLPEDNYEPELSADSVFTETAVTELIEQADENQTSSDIQFDELPEEEPIRETTDSLTERLLSQGELLENEEGLIDGLPGFKEAERTELIPVNDLLADASPEDGSDDGNSEVQTEHIEASDEDGTETELENFTDNQMMNDDILPVSVNEDDYTTVGEDDVLNLEDNTDISDMSEQAYEMISGDNLPENMITEDLIPEDIISEDINPEDILPEDIHPEDILSEDVTDEKNYETEILADEVDEILPSETVEFPDEIEKSDAGFLTGSETENLDEIFEDSMEETSDVLSEEIGEFLNEAETEDAALLFEEEAAAETLFLEEETEEEIEALFEEEAEEAVEVLLEEEEETEEAAEVLFEETADVLFGEEETEEAIEAATEALLEEEEKETEEAAEALFEEEETEKEAEEETEAATEGLLEEAEEGTEVETEAAAEALIEEEEETEEETEEAIETLLEDETEEETEETPGAERIVQVSGADYELHVSYGPEAKIPANARFTAIALQEDSTDYSKYEAQALDAVPNDNGRNGAAGIAAMFDLTIYDAAGENILQPEAPVSVTVDLSGSMTADKDVYAVHFPGSSVSEGSAGADTAEELMSEDAAEELMQEDGAEESGNADISENEDLFDEIRKDPSAGMDEEYGSDETAAPEVLDAVSAEGEVSFEAASFSVYAVVYTVDFHYEVNGKMYEFSIPGGGFASFYKIVEVLGISNPVTQSGFGGENEAENREIGAGNSENSDENDVYNVVEEAGVEDVDTYNDSISLNNIEVSEMTKKFVSDVASVEFSSPDLVWVGKVEDATTVGGLKEANGLEVQYSAELTEEEIAEINSSTVEAGDWALISMLPFTSEESLTVTMMNGDQFVVRVTDGQEATEVADIDTDGFYVIYVDRYYNNTHHYYALRNDGASVAVPNNNLDALGNEFTWRFGYDETACWWYNGSSFIEPEWSIVVGDNPGGRYLWIEKRGSGFGIHGNYWSDNYLSWDSSNGFKIVNNGFDVAIKIYEKDKPQLNFSVAVNNPSYGSVSCSNTVTDLEWKNTVPIVATPAEGCYFVGWRRGDEVLTGYDSTIPVGGIEFTQDNQILTAVFAKNYTSPATQEINEWVDSLLGNPLVSDKTAHAVDYDNRIYEVDLTASSSRYTIDQDIRIEFITDISRSMYFPETLLNEQDFTVNGQINLGQWLLDNGDPGEVYYVIGDINNTATMYAVYFSGNDYFTRWSIIDASYYLPYDNASTSGRIKNVCQISNGNTTVSITDRFADNRIFTGKIYNSTPKPPKDTADWDRLSYLTAAVKAVSRAIYRLDPGAEIGLVTFASAASGGTLYGADDEASLISEINSIQPVGGTNQTSAFNLINNSNPPVFTTNSGKRQVALLITDGAPQGTTWDAIERAAGTTEGNGVEIWTLGLALDRVGNNKSRLMNLASEGGYSGNAEDADQLVTETKKILEKMLVKATVIGEVYDTVDPAFYPVDTSGNPIKEGYYYADSTGGSITRHSSAPSDVKKAYYH